MHRSQVCAGLRKTKQCMMLCDRNDALPAPLCANWAVHHNTSWKTQQAVVPMLHKHALEAPAGSAAWCQGHQCHTPVPVSHPHCSCAHHNPNDDKTNRMQDSLTARFSHRLQRHVFAVAECIIQAQGTQALISGSCRGDE